MTFPEVVHLYGTGAVFTRHCWPTQVVYILRACTLWYRRFEPDHGYRWVPTAMDLCAVDWTLSLQRRPAKEAARG